MASLCLTLYIFVVWLNTLVCTCVYVCVLCATDKKLDARPIKGATNFSSTMSV